MGQGFYLMRRGWLDDEMFQSPKREPFCHRAAWAWLIEHAAYRPETVRGHQIERGQIAATLLDMGGAWGWNTTKVARFLTALRERGLIVTATVRSATVITICFYHEYQASENATVTPTVTPTVATVKRDRYGLDKQGKEEKKDSDANASGAGAPNLAPDPAADPVKELWDRGLAILGNKNRSLLGKYVSQYGKPVVLAAIVETERERPVEPVSYFIECCERRRANGRDQSVAYDILARAAIEQDEREGHSGSFEASH